MDGRGRFVNLNHPFLPRTMDLLKWQLSPNPDRDRKKNDTFRPVLHGDKLFLDSSNDCLVWLGHASFFLRLGGKRMIIDPVFGDIRPGPKRIWSPLFTAADFGELDYILVSHDHRDHADEASIRELYAKNPGTQFLTGLGMEPLLREWTGKQQVQMAGWYQEYQTDGMTITYLPTRHWGRRGLTDTNKRLWGAFHIAYKGFSIYFSGDTGYDTHLADVRTLFGAPDICIIGVGAYKPEWFMGSNHISPVNAMKAADEMGARMMIPMHYGTFDLSDEPMGDPYTVLQRAERGGKYNTELRIAGVGEPILCYNDSGTP